MIYLLWSIINLFIVLYFICLLFGLIFIGRKVLTPKFKTISVFILMIGVVQIISASDEKEISNRLVINEMPKDKNNSKSKIINLEENLFMGITLLISYADDNGTYLPTTSHSNIYGLVSGFEWEYSSVQTDILVANQKAKYKVDGVLKWTLFGINVYNQPKSFQGFID